MDCSFVEHLFVGFIRGGRPMGLGQIQRVSWHWSSEPERANDTRKMILRSSMWAPRKARPDEKRCLCDNCF